MFGIFTIRQAEQMAFWKKDGTLEIKQGPFRGFVSYVKAAHLKRWTADASQYLIIKQRDGDVVHVPGPAELFQHPVDHEAIYVANADIIEAGQAVTIYTRNPDNSIDYRTLVGPAQFVPRPNQWLKPQALFTADESQYLIVRYSDGRTEHITGPAAVHRDPVRHEDIRVAAALPIDSNEAVVVYRRTSTRGPDNPPTPGTDAPDQREGEGKDKGETMPPARLQGNVQRRVLRGPAQFVPRSDEWLHEFRWHGADPKNPRQKIPRGLQFKKLRVIPDQMYVDVPDVRTADDALVVVKLMVFFELVDIETMLDQTHDPVADFLNAVTADVIEFASGLTFDQFKHQTDKLNEMETYPSLTGRGQRIGYAIRNVVYRGYDANVKLQQMHDNAIEMRTRLKLETETEQQAQALADMKLQREADRARTQQQVEREQAQHARALRQLEHEQKVKQAEAEAQQQATGQRLLNEVEMDQIKARYREKATLLAAMSEMGIDVTQYLVAPYQRHPDRVIQIDGDRGDQLHMFAEMEPEDAES